jgi:hypothetical protein
VHIGFTKKQAGGIIMMVMTAKVDKKKLALVAAGIVVLIVGLVLLFGRKDETPTAATATTATSVVGNDDRVRFLNGFGWDVTTSPTESSQVRIPEKASDVFDRYNELQKSQGYDLSRYAGQTVMRYVYKVNNYPGATEPVYATVLISKNQVIGGDVTDTSAKGIIQGFKMPESVKQTQPTETQEATEPTSGPVETTGAAS